MGMRRRESSGEAGSRQLASNVIEYVCSGGGCSESGCAICAGYDFLSINDVYKSFTGCV